MQKGQNIRFIGRQILFEAFIDKDSSHGVIVPAYQVVVFPGALPALSQRTV